MPQLRGVAGCVALLVAAAAGELCVTDSMYDVKYGAFALPKTIKGVTDAQACATKCQQAEECACFTFSPKTKECRGFSSCGTANTEDPAAKGLTSGRAGCVVPPSAAECKKKLTDATAAVGMKVIRGPDWSWADQDGGEGNVGTLIRRTMACEGGSWWKVHWPGVGKQSYRLGCNNSNDLARAGCGGSDSQARRCAFNDIFWPQGASPGGAGCERDSVVPDGHSCSFHRADYSCETVTCRGSQWSTLRPRCLPTAVVHPNAGDASEGCPFDVLKVPREVTASGLSTGCHEGGSVPRGSHCMFLRPGHSCSTVSCDDKGFWSAPAPVCTAREQGAALPQCSADALSLPERAAARAECSKAAAGMFCTVEKEGHNCDLAICGSDGRWVNDKPACSPIGCHYSELQVPPAAYSVGEGCHAGGVVAEGSLCSFQKPEHKCDIALCTAAAGWTTTTPRCHRDEKAQPAKIEVCEPDVQYMRSRVGNLMFEIIETPSVEECSDACKERGICKCFTYSGHNQQCALLEQCQTPTPRAHVFHYVSGPAGCRPPTPASAKVARDCRLQAKDAKEGMRVVRGADWKWGDQDGSGEGVLLKRSADCDGGTWFSVQWGVTKVTNDYRVGCGGRSDLCSPGTSSSSTVSGGGRAAPVGRGGGAGGRGRGGGRGGGGRAAGRAGGRGAAAPHSGAAYRCEPDRDAPGHDIYAVPNVPNMQQCQHYCSNLPECEAVVLRADNWCSLKRAAAFGEASKGSRLCKRVADTKVALPNQLTQQDAQAHGFVCRDGERFTGSELFQLEAVDRAACWTHCLQAPDCRGVTHSASSCSLHLDISKLGEAPAGTAACERTVRADKPSQPAYYKCQKDHTFKAGDLLHLLDIESRQACEEYCTKVAECVALVWREGTCTLKAFLTSPHEVGPELGFVACAKTHEKVVTPAVDSTSSNGKPYVCQSAARFTGPVLFEFKGLQAPKDCATVCDGIQDCAAVNFHSGETTESACKLIGDVGMLVPTDGVVACNKPGVQAEVLDINSAPTLPAPPARSAFTLETGSVRRRARVLSDDFNFTEVQALLAEVAVCGTDQFGQRVCGPSANPNPPPPVAAPYWTLNNQGQYVRELTIQTVRPLGFDWRCFTEQKPQQDAGLIATLVDIPRPEDCQLLCDQNPDCFAWLHMAKCPSLTGPVTPNAGKCLVCKLYNCDLAPNSPTNPPATVTTEELVIPPGGGLPVFVGRFATFCYNDSFVCSNVQVGICGENYDVNQGEEMSVTVGDNTCSSETSCIEDQEGLSVTDCSNHCDNLTGCIGFVWYLYKYANGTGDEYCMFYNAVTSVVSSPRNDSDVLYCGPVPTPAPTGMAFHISTFLPMQLCDFRPFIPAFILNVTNWLNTFCIPAGHTPIVADDLVVCVYDLYTKEMEFYPDPNGRDNFIAKHPNEYENFAIPTEFVFGKWHAGPGPHGTHGQTLHRRAQVLSAKGTMISVQMARSSGVNNTMQQQALVAAVAAAADNLAPRKYSCQTAYAFAGGDIAQHAGLDSADECLKKCTNTSGCTKLNFDVDHTCFLKSDEATASVATGETAVVGCEWDRNPRHVRTSDRYHCEADMAFVGGDIFVLRNLNDADTCKKMCSQLSQECDLAMFYGDGTCALKRLSEAAEVDTPELSGVACKAITDAPELTDKFHCAPGSYMGGELFQVEDVASKMACAEYCHSVQLCAVAVYDDRKHCSLRSADAAFQPDKAAWAPGAQACVKASAADVQPAQQDQYHCDANVGHTGIDLSVVQDVAQADDCLAACTRHAQCRVAVYKDQVCSLKGADAEPSAAKGAVSCIRRAALEEAPRAADDFQCVTDRMFEGGDLMQMENVGSMRECQAQCAAIADCAVVVHRSGVCLLKNTDAKAVRAEALRGGATACAKKAQAAALRLAARPGGGVYDCREGVTYDGGRLVTADNVADHSKCEGLCDMVPECAVAIWERGACTLASASATRVTVPEAVTSCAKVAAGSVAHKGTETFDCTASTTYPGSDLLLVRNVETLADCRAHCADVPDCAVAIHSHGTCALKGEEAARGAPHSAAGATACLRGTKTVAMPHEQSGRRCEIGATLAGGHLYDVSGVKSSDECMRHCRKVSTECRGFTFSSDGLCSLRGTGATLRRATGTDKVSCLSLPKAVSTQGAAFQCSPGRVAEGPTLKGPVDVESNDECLGMCAAEPACGGFSYSKQRCTLKGAGVRLLPSVSRAGTACLRQDAHSVAPPKTAEPFRCILQAGYLGADLQVLGGVRTVDDCEAHCATDPACAAVVHTEQGVCYLKGAEATPVTRRVLVNVLSRSAEVEPPPVGTACVRSSATRERHAADLADKKGFACDIGRQFIGGELLNVGGVTAEDCQAQCARVPQCAALVYTTERRCSLRTSVAAPVRDASGTALACVRTAGSDDGAAAAGFRCDAHGSFSGGELLSVDGVHTPGDCAAHCSVVPGCEIAVHNAQFCVLYSADAVAGSAGPANVVCTRAVSKQQPQAAALSQPRAAAARWQCAEHSFGGDGHGDLFLLEGVGSLRLCQQQCAGLASCGGVEYRRKQLACVLKVTGSTPTGGSDPSADPVSCVRVDAPAPQGLPPCACAAHWTAEEDGEACSAAQHGCPSKACDGSPRRWCRVAQIGCATEEYGGWSYCDESTPSEREGALASEAARFHTLDHGHLGAYSDGSSNVQEYTEWAYTLSFDGAYNQQVGFYVTQETAGPTVSQVEAGSPAAGASMKVGERVTKVDGTAVTTDAELWSAIQAAQTGGATSVVVYALKEVPPLGKIWSHDFSHAINIDYLDLPVWRGTEYPNFAGNKTASGGGFWVRTRVDAKVGSITAPFRYNWYLIASGIQEALVKANNPFMICMNPVLEQLHMQPVQNGTIVGPAIIQPKLYSRVPIAKVAGSVMYLLPWKRYSFLQASDPQVSHPSDTYLGETAIAALVDLLQAARGPPYFQIIDIEECSDQGTPSDTSDDLCCLFYACPNGYGGHIAGCLDRNGDSIEMRERRAREMNISHPYETGGWLEGLDQPAQAPTTWSGPYGHLFNKTAWYAGQGRQQCSLGAPGPASSYYSKMRYTYIIDQDPTWTYDERMAFLEAVLAACQTTCAHVLGHELATGDGSYFRSVNATNTTSAVDLPTEHRRFQEYARKAKPQYYPGVGYTFITESWASATFDRLDTSGDGTLSRAELGDPATNSGVGWDRSDSVLDYPWGRPYSFFSDGLYSYAYGGSVGALLANADNGLVDKTYYLNVQKFLNFLTQGASDGVFDLYIEVLHQFHQQQGAAGVFEWTPGANTSEWAPQDPDDVNVTYPPTVSPTHGPTGDGDGGDGPGGHDGKAMSVASMRHLLQSGAVQLDLMHGDRAIADLTPPSRSAKLALMAAGNGQGPDRDARAAERFARAAEDTRAAHSRTAHELQFKAGLRFTVSEHIPAQVSEGAATTALGALSTANGRTVIAVTVTEHPDHAGQQWADLLVNMTISGSGGSPSINTLDADAFAADIAAAFLPAINVSKWRVKDSTHNPASADFSGLPDNNVRAVFRLQNRLQREEQCKLGNLGEHYGLVSNKYNLDDGQPFVGTLAECTRLCHKKSNCYGFSRQNQGTADDNKPLPCYLKRYLIPYLGDQYAFDNYTTCAVRCPSSPNRCTWTMLQGVAVHVLEQARQYPSRMMDSAEHCQDACETVPTCVAISWRPVVHHSETSRGYCFFVTERDGTRVDHEEFTGYLCRRMYETPSPYVHATPRPAEWGTCAATGDAACAATGSMCLQGHGAWRCVCGPGYHCRGCTQEAMQQNAYCDCSTPHLPKHCVPEPRPTPTMPPCNATLAATAMCGDPRTGHTCSLNDTGYICGCAPDYHCHGPTCSGAGNVARRCIPDSCLPELVGPEIADEVLLMDECPSWYHGGNATGDGDGADGDGNHTGDGDGADGDGNHTGDGDGDGFMFAANNPCLFAFPNGLTRAGLNTIMSEFMVPHEYPCRRTSTCARLQEIIAMMVDTTTWVWRDHMPPLQRQRDAIRAAYMQCAAAAHHYHLTPAPTGQSLEAAWIKAVHEVIDAVSETTNLVHADCEVDTVPEWYIYANFSDTRPLRFPEPFGVSVTFIPVHSQTTHTVAFVLQNVTVDTIWGGGGQTDGIEDPGPLGELREQLASSEGIPMEHIIFGRICLTRALTGEDYGCYDPAGNPYPSSHDPHPWNVSHWYPFAYSPGTVHVTVCERVSDTGAYIDPGSNKVRLNTGQTADQQWTIQCPSGVLSITNVFYGREHCHNELCFAFPANEPTNATNCDSALCPEGQDCACHVISQAALENHVHGMCNGNQQCLLDVASIDSTAGLETNCPDENKYLWVEYDCVGGTNSRRAATLSEAREACRDGGCNVQVEMRLNVRTAETVRVVRRPGGGVSQLRAGDPIMSHVTVAERIGAATEALDRIVDNNILQATQERAHYKFSAQAVKAHVEGGIVSWIKKSFGHGAAAHFPGACHVAVSSRDVDCVSGKCRGTGKPAVVRQTDCQGRWQCSEHHCNSNGVAEGFDGECSCKCRPGFVGERCEICDTDYAGYPDCKYVGGGHAEPGAERANVPAQEAAKGEAKRQAVSLAAFPSSSALRRMRVTQVIDVARNVGLDVDKYESKMEYVDAIERERTRLGGRTPAPTQAPVHTELFHVALAVPLSDIPQRHAALRSALDRALSPTQPLEVRISAACPISACHPECPSSGSATAWDEDARDSCIPIGVLLSKGAAAVNTADVDGLMGPLPEGGIIEVQADFSPEAPDIELKSKLIAAVLAAALHQPDSPLHGLGVLGTVHSAADGRVAGETQHDTEGTDSVAWIPVVVCVGVLLLCAVWAVLVGLYARSRGGGTASEKVWLNAPETALADECLVLKRPGEQLGIAWEDHTVVVSVSEGSPADRAGAARFIGRRVTHVNGTPVRRLGEIRDASIGAATAWLRFSRGAEHDDGAEQEADLYVLSEWCEQAVAACAGAYRLLPSLVINDHPVYERADKARWFYCTVRGQWVLTDSQDDFSKGKGVLFSAGVLVGNPPHAAQEWRTRLGETCDAIVTKEIQTAHGFRVGQWVACAQDVSEHGRTVIRCGQLGIVKGVSSTLPDRAVCVRFQGLSRDVNAMPEELDSAAGPRVMVQTAGGQWRECQVVNADGESIKVHFIGMGKQYDEWLSKESERIAPMRSAQAPGVGDTVRLSHGTAARGCLQDGEEGVLVRDAGPQSVAPFKVRGPRGDTSWYQADELEHSTAKP